MVIMKVLKWTLPVSMFAALFVLSTVKAEDAKQRAQTMQWQ